MNFTQIYFFTLVFSISYISSSEAYFGPGIGLGLFATIISIFAGILLFIFSVLYYPVKKLLKKNQKKSKKIKKKSKK